ncbi:MAG: hypothetical protein HY645_12535 [Acidobacteria bacterium]|nr:hypothetical protein [Acidobacteriota bacterium]
MQNIKKAVEGIVCAVLLVLTFILEIQPSSAIARHLVVCLDGVSFSEFRDLQATGAFRFLRSPSQVISPFPSLTNPAMVEILRPLGSPLARGYEDTYYSWEKDRILGGFISRFREDFIRGTFRELFHFHPSAVESALEYVFPPWSCERAARLDFQRGLERFKSSKVATFLLYVGPTDCVAHTGGAPRLRKTLHFVDRELAKLKREQPETVISLFSDHGNEFGSYRRADPASALEGVGFQQAPDLKSKNTFVMPAYGLVGAVVVFVGEQDVEKTALALSHAEGVAFSSFTRGERVTLIEAGRISEISKRGERLGYVPADPDPLQLGITGFYLPQQWFEFTKNHYYADAINRLWQSSRTDVLNPASLIVSLKPGFYFGSRLLDIFASLKSTHGNLNQEQSAGFAATSRTDLPTHVSAGSLWKVLVPNAAEQR